MLLATESAYFFGGFVAAEGTFYRTGNRFIFAVGLSAKDAHMCEVGRALIGVGSITRWPRRKPHYDDEVRFAVQSTNAVIDFVIPFMDRFLPASLKRDQYLKWRVELLEFWEHQAKRRRPCTVTACDRPRRAKGLCRQHYFEIYRK